MLVIKEERMQDLVNFGFKKERLATDDAYTRELSLCVFLCVYCKNCEMWIADENPFIPNVVYDLIEAGMIEKEGEK